MAVSVKEVKSKSELRKYIYLPAKFHKGHSTWLPPIYMDEWNIYNPKKNNAFSYCDTTLALAYRDGQVVGRIMGIINKRYNSIHKDNSARFEYMECSNDKEIFHALITYIENWAKEKGMTKVVGPSGFSDKEPQGFLIDGFEHTGILDAPNNHPYMVELLEAEGYTKFTDLSDYLIDVPREMPELYYRVFRRVTAKNEFQIKEFKTRKELKPYIIPVFELVNETYQHIYGFIPMEELEMIEMADRYLPILDPEFVKVILKDGQVVAFVVTIPDISEGLQKSKGHLFPFGIFHILKSLKNSKKLLFMLMAVKPKYRGIGIDTMLIIKTLESCIKRKMIYVESHLILDTNTQMIGEVIKAGGKVHQKFRIFQKNIN
jgi:GNAT superfamily N-acetyltransferase